MTTVEQMDARPDTGGWVPPDLVETPPVFVWPPRPAAFIKWLFGYPGYLWPWNALWVVFALFTYFVFLPDLSEMKTLQFGWIAKLLLLHLVMVSVFATIWHVRLYVQRRQDIEFKYNKRWPKANETFLFNSQLYDNMFWTLASGVPIFTAFLVFSLWAMANGWYPIVGWGDHPVYCVVVMLLIPLYREVHFYIIHRLIHWPPLYRTVHSLHHKNSNPGPWSGLAMHPVEHVLFFSGILIHFIVPSNPFIILYHLQIQLWAPIEDHCGFGKVVVNGKVQIDAATYMHYLHHRYFEVNYGGNGTVPLDRWLGTWHDGSTEAHEVMNRRFMQRHSKQA